MEHINTVEQFFQKKGGNIYLVDDNNSVRTSLARLLTTIGYTVDSYSSGADFLEKYKPISPAVILLDMVMPKTTGIQLQQNILDLGFKTQNMHRSNVKMGYKIIKISNTHTKLNLIANLFF
jgi:FixJ family two-component response regulator